MEAITRRNGQTLIEILMAIMITAGIAAAVFSVILSAQLTGSRSDKREAAAMAIKAAQEQLKIYVSAAPGEKAYSPTTTEGAYPPQPWEGGTSWVWALAGGSTHDISSLLKDAPQFEGTAPPVLTYTVENRDCGFGTGDTVACKQVTFKITYED